MRGFWLTLALGIGFVVLFVWVWLYERGEIVPPEELKKQIYNLEKEKIISLTLGIEKPIQCEKDKEGNWYITKPKKVKADKNKIEDMLEELSPLKAERNLGKMEDLSPYGLDKPSFKIRIKTEEGKEKVLLVGEEAPLGGEIYVKDLNLPEVFLISSYKIEKFKKELNELRDRKIIDFKNGEVKEVHIKKGEEEILLARDEEGKWKMKKPWEIEGDEDDISSFFWEVKALRVDEFVEDEPKSLKKYGLQNPRIRIDFILGEDRAFKSLLYGKEEGEKIYLKRGSLSSVWLVRKDNFNPFDLTSSKLAQKKLWDLEKGRINLVLLEEGEKKYRWEKKGEEWTREGKKIKKESADDLLWEVNYLKAEEIVGKRIKPSYGLDKPRFKLTIGSNGEKKTLLGGKEKEEKIYAKLEKGRWVYLIKKSKIERIIEKIKEEPEEENK